MSPVAAIWMTWAVTSLWPLVGSAGVRLLEPPLFLEAGILIAVCVLSPVLISRGGFRRMLAPDVRRSLFLAGLLASGTASLVYLWALRYTSPGAAAVVSQVEILYSAILSRRFLSERIGWEQAAATALVLAGTLLILAHDAGNGHWKGDLMILATPWLYQVSHVLVKRLPPDVDAVTIAGARLFYAAWVLLPFAAWALVFQGGWPRHDGFRIARLLLVQGGVVSAAQLVLWYRAIRGADLAKSTAIILSYPALTLLLSRVLGFEMVDAAKLMGLALSFWGALWLSRLVRGGAAASTALQPAG